LPTAKSGSFEKQGSLLFPWKTWTHVGRRRNQDGALKYLLFRPSSSQGDLTVFRSQALGEAAAKLGEAESSVRGFQIEGQAPLLWGLIPLSMDRTACPVWKVIRKSTWFRKIKIKKPP
jgi:hypothetical protein